MHSSTSADVDMYDCIDGRNDGMEGNSSSLILNDIVSAYILFRSSLVLKCSRACSQES